MDTFQIAPTVLENYVNNKLTKERIDFLIAQANEQLDEIAQKSELYNAFMREVNLPDTIDRLILWIFFMSNETICDTYISEFNKDFREIIPVSDLADLLSHVVYLKKLKDTTLEGFEYLLENKHEGIDEVDHYCFMNVLLHVQKTKETQMEF